ncbi:MAG: hypothetical protein ACTHOR_12695, partial [Devosia sp.]
MEAAAGAAAGFVPPPAATGFSSAEGGVAPDVAAVVDEGAVPAGPAAGAGAGASGVASAAVA